jgi:DNA polymerase-3 subunit epsilon
MEGFITVIDFEGTSINQSPRATEIGLVALDENFEEVASFESLVNPPVEAQASSLAFSHLTRKEIKAAPTFIELWPSIHPFLNSRLLVAHNKIYEEGVIKREFEDLGIATIPNFLCTYHWGRRVIGQESENHKLGTLCAHLGVALTNAHEALADARATAEVLKKLVSRSRELKTFIEGAKNSVVEFDHPRMQSKQSVTRFRFINDEESGHRVELAIKRIKTDCLKLVVLTGTPIIGKDGFRELMASQGLENRETPPTMGTAFVLRANKSPGMSKIKTAQKYGVPVLLESDLPALLAQL